MQQDLGARQEGSKIHKGFGDSRHWMDGSLGCVLGSVCAMAVCVEFKCVTYYCR